MLSTTADRVAQAAVVVVARDGFDVLSVRTVAREAGVSAGTVQYHFPTRTRLLAGAFAHTITTITGRLEASRSGGPVAEVIGRLCREALPLDAQRTRECAVWAALSAASVVHQELAAEHRKALDFFTDTVTAAITTAQKAGELGSEVQPATAAAVLLAVLDGLTLHGVAGSRSPRDLTTTLDTAVALVLHLPA